MGQMTERETLDLLAGFLAGRGDGDESDALHRHLLECEDCREWAAGTGHPTSDELAHQAVGRGRLVASEHRWVARHLEACSECRREVELTRAALSAARAESPAPLPFVGRGPRASYLAPRWAIAAGLILVAALAFTFGRTPAPEGLRDRVLKSQTLAGTRLVEAPGSITATAVTIDSGSSVVFRAGTTIALGNGFAVANGATLEVQSALGPGEALVPNGSS